MVFGFIVRCGLVVGAVYYSRKLGIWGTSKQTEQLYEDLKTEIRPHVQKLEKELPFEVPSLPQSGEVRFLAKHYFNTGVKETFHFISMLPTHSQNLAIKVNNVVTDFVAPPKPIADSTKANSNTSSTKS